MRQVKIKDKILRNLLKLLIHRQCAFSFLKTILEKRLSAVRLLYNTCFYEWFKRERSLKSDSSYRKLKSMTPKRKGRSGLVNLARKELFFSEDYRPSFSKIVRRAYQSVNPNIVGVDISTSWRDAETIQNCLKKNDASII
jgi:hypothetical protein